jgi:hypothetical protein
MPLLRPGELCEERGLPALCDTADVAPGGARTGKPICPAESAKRRHLPCRAEAAKEGAVSVVGYSGSGMDVDSLPPHTRAEEHP